MAGDKDFINMIRNISLKSDDPNTKVGACIVKNGRILGEGYNCWPRGCEFSWEHKKDYVCHAELIAILSSQLSELPDSTIYVSLHPCNECAKLIIQSGIKTVLYESDEKNYKRKYKTAAFMFQKANVKCQQYVAN